MNTFELLCKELESKVKKGTLITRGSTMSELGLDSLDLVDVVLVIEEKLDVVFDDDDLIELHTIGDVVRIIDSKRS